MDIETVYAELEKVKNERAALQTQSLLLEKFVAMAHSKDRGELLNGILSKVLEISAELTGAEKGSLFLLNPEGVVTDSILTRDSTDTGQRSELIGKVLDQGLAGWVLRHRKVGLIEDTAEDERWLTLPDQPYRVRSALAAPIFRGDRLMGLMTLLHSRPGRFAPDTADVIKSTSAQIALVLENVRLYAKLDESYHQLEEAKKQAEEYSRALDAELSKGRKIQLDLLPKRSPGHSGWDIETFFSPAWQVSGDFFDIFNLSDQRLGLVIADVSDKGVGAALFMALFRSLIRAYAGRIDPKAEELENQPYDPLNAVRMTNDYISQNHSEDGMFVTLFFGALDLETGLLTYVNAGHEPLFMTGSEGLKAKLNSTGPAVGILPEADFKSEEIRFDPGDILFGYTDGVTDALSPDGEMFFRQGIVSLLENPGDSSLELIERVKSGLFAHMEDAAQIDDITMLAIRRRL